MIDDKQFVLSKKVHAKQGWMSVRLSNGYYLSYEQHLNVVYNNAKDAALLGYAWQTDEDRLDPDVIVKSGFEYVEGGALKIL